MAGRIVQLFPLILKITGKVKFNPSSATSGGGCGTGSERLIMASAASSNALSVAGFALGAGLCDPGF